eukprot:161892-Chlamydomonas_euryale.AAC.2
MQHSAWAMPILLAPGRVPHPLQLAHASTATTPRTCPPYCQSLRATAPRRPGDGSAAARAARGSR